MAFITAGHDAQVVHSEQKQEVNDKILDAFDRGVFNILVNVAILTEGYDCPPVDCICLVRGCSSQGTMTQMLGRGLRVIEPGEYEWSNKENCLILDFGDSIRVHGTLRSDANLRKIREQRQGDDPFAMFCPHCETMIIVDIDTEVCPECNGNILEAVAEEMDAEPGEGVPGPQKLLLTDFSMTEAKLTGYSPFAWVDLTEELMEANHNIFVANGFDSHVVIFRKYDHDMEKAYCIAIGKKLGSKHAVVGRGREKVVFAQANNFMSNNETSTSSKKSAGWMRRSMTGKQLSALEKCGWKRSAEMPGRYTASCLLTYIFNHREIKNLRGRELVASKTVS